MGWRVGAGWALVGFAAQCFLALGAVEPLDSGMRRALVHYVAWGIAGFLVGTLVEYALGEAVRNRMKREEQRRREQQTLQEAEAAAVQRGGA